MDWAPRAEARDVASTIPKAAQVITTSATRRNAAIFTDTRQGCQLFSRVLGGAGAFAFTSFCAGGGLVLITEGALRGKITASFSAACVPFNVCGSVVGTAFLHSRNGFVISNQPLSPANQPSEECAAKTRWSCCSIRIASSFLPANVSPLAGVVSVFSTALAPNGFRHL